MNLKTKSTTAERKIKLIQDYIKLKTFTRRFLILLLFLQRLNSIPKPSLYLSALGQVGGVLCHVNNG